MNRYRPVIYIQKIEKIYFISYQEKYFYDNRKSEDCSRSEVIFYGSFVLIIEKEGIKCSLRFPDIPYLVRYPKLPTILLQAWFCIINTCITRKTDSIGVMRVHKLKNSCPALSVWLNPLRRQPTKYWFKSPITFGTQIVRNLQGTVEDRHLLFTLEYAIRTLVYGVC